MPRQSPRERRDCLLLFNKERGNHDTDGTNQRGSDKPITADDELSVLMAAMKKRKEAIELYEKAGRDELARQEQEELKIISSYLPAPLPREEAEKVVAT